MKNKLQNNSVSQNRGNPLLCVVWREFKKQMPTKEGAYLLYCEIYEEVVGQEGNEHNFMEVGYWNGRKFYISESSNVEQDEIKYWTELPLPPNYA